MRNSFVPRSLMLPAVLAFAACSIDEAAEPAAENRAERSLPVQALEVAPRDLSRVIQVSSMVEPLRTIRLAARTDGVLTDVLVEEGDEIGAGQVLARIDVREQQAELARARARLNEKRANFERMESLMERDYVDAATFEAARAELAVAESEVRLWQTRVEFGTVNSTIDGTVVERYVEPGEAVGRHAPLFSLADLSTQVLRLGISELDIPNLKVGDTVSVRVDAVTDGNPLIGELRRIFPAAEADSRLVTVEVDLPEARGLGVRPGFLARAELVVDLRPNALAVPAGAVAQAGDGYYVMVIGPDNRLRRQTVQPGVIRGAWREIIAGLEPGDRVVAANPLDMGEGELVRIVGWAG